MKKEETVITIANGGMHSQTNYRKCKAMIRDNKYAMPRLYSLVFKGSKDKEVYLTALNALCEEMRNNNIPCKWKTCFEMDEEKGLHLHAMILLDAKHGRPDYYIRYADDGFLVLMLKELGLTFNISRPRNKIHRTATGKRQNYAYITKSGPKLEDALIWCSYLYKKRSKDDSMKTIYHSSRERASKPVPVPPSAPQADKETFSPISLKGNDMQLTLAQTFIASKYEQGVDQQLDVEALRLYLLSHGVKRTPAMVAHELEHTYGFYGYASSHAAPAKDDVALLDALIDRTPLKSARQAHLSHGQGQLIVSGKLNKIYQTPCYL